LPQPFIEEGHLVLRLFPPVTVVYLPLVLLGTVFLSTVTGYVGFLFVEEGLRQQG